MVDVMYGKIALLMGIVTTILIRWPHDKVAKVTKIIHSRRTKLEIFLMAMVGLGFFVIPIVYMTTSTFTFADYSLSRGFFIAGLGCLVLNFWLFYRSHKDLGRNWSPTLQIRNEHQLIQWGVYKKIRHPMYTAIFLYGMGQFFLLPNWIAGPSFILAFVLMFSLRVKREEKMLIDQFGDQYFQYMNKTKRIIPYVY